MAETKTIGQLKQAVKTAEKVEGAANRQRKAAEQRLGNAIAQTMGIKKGQMYYFLPSDGRKFLVEVRDIGTFNPRYNGKRSLGVLLHYHNRNGRYMSRWHYMDHGELIPTKQGKDAN